MDTTVLIASGYLLFKRNLFRNDFVFIVDIDQVDSVRILQQANGHFCSGGPDVFSYHFPAYICYRIGDII